MVFLRLADAHHNIKRRLSLHRQVLLVKWKALHPESVEKLGEHAREAVTLQTWALDVERKLFIRTYCVVELPAKPRNWTDSSDSLRRCLDDI
jgi:hypothetical protein